MTRRPRAPRPIVALVAATALLLAGCGDDDPTVEVGAPDEAEEPEETEPEAAEDTDPPAAADDDGDGGTTGGASGGASGGGATDGTSTAGPTPDPDLVAEPCADHQGREGEAFIAVVSPVSEQLVSEDRVELVGCSNVYEATVQWSLYDGDGRELDTGFTTAECGSGCVGAFRDEVPLGSAAGEPYAELHVYAEDASGGEDRRHLIAIPLTLS